MLNKILEIFQDSHTRSFNQSQREACADLLILTMLADSRTREQEKDVIESAFENSWDSEDPFHVFYISSVKRALNIMNSDVSAQMQKYIDDIYNRLESTSARTQTLDVCSRLAKSDRELSSEEEKLLNQIENSFKRKTSANK